MSSLTSKMLKNQGYTLPKNVRKLPPEIPNETFTSKFLRGAGFNGPQDVEQDDKKVDTPDEPQKSYVSKFLTDSGFSGLPAAGSDRSSKAKNASAYESQNAGMRFDV